MYGLLQVTVFVASGLASYKVILYRVVMESATCPTKGRLALHGVSDVGSVRKSIGGVLRTSSARCVCVHERSTHFQL